MSNRLKNESSPYLQQHADNPVDWYPWGEEAFEKAKKENKLIFLSIGYSTCHWCHVMAHESFEDQKVADILNENFVSIKLDREERPDIDKTYMNVCQIMNGSGGWPLTIIMTPGKKPFFSGTYIPKSGKMGMMGLVDLLKKVEEMWESEPQKLKETGQNIKNMLESTVKKEGKQKMSKFVLRNAFHIFSKSFDTHYGGFLPAPKFPSPHNLMFLLRYWKSTKNKEALRIVKKTLRKMRLGGIYDHIGGGFHRYSTDNEWLVPHFEKMIYDQALLTIIYLEAYQITQEEIYVKTARDILKYVLRHMKSEEGGFFTAEDADSEGEEGVFYTWTLNELKSILTENELKVTKKVYQVEQEGNYLDESTKKKNGRNILHLKDPLNEQNVEKETIEKINEKLYRAREQKIHPQKDTKRLTDWNSLMIVALSKASRIDKKNKEKYQKEAENAITYLIKNHFNGQEELLHQDTENKENRKAFIDDYAFFIWALLEMFQTNFNPKHINLALRLQEEMFDQFWDEDGGAFFFSSKEEEAVLAQQKVYYDGAIPSGNSVAFYNIMRLYHLTSDNKYFQKAENLMQNYATKVFQASTSYTFFLLGVDIYYVKNHLLTILGPGKEEVLGILREKFLPYTLILAPKNKDHKEKLEFINPALPEMRSPQNGFLAYICDEKSCKVPVSSIEDILEIISS